MASLRRTDPDALPTALSYTRVSLDEMAREGLSLPAQLAEARRYAAQRGWVLGAEYQDAMKGNSFISNQIVPATTLRGTFPALPQGNAALGVRFSTTMNDVYFEETP